MSFHTFDGSPFPLWRKNSNVIVTFVTRLWGKTSELWDINPVCWLFPLQFWGFLFLLQNKKIKKIKWIFNDFLSLNILSTSFTIQFLLRSKKIQNDFHNSDFFLSILSLYLALLTLNLTIQTFFFSIMSLDLIIFILYLATLSLKLLIHFFSQYHEFISCNFDLISYNLLFSRICQTKNPNCKI